MKKRFGSINLTWPKLIVWAVLAGVYTAVMAILPAAKDTSFADISISFECWVLFGILIIVNSKTPLDSALKCFVFFLISQPLVYLVQVPFSALGWQLFRYYPTWFVWTLLTFPMGYVGWYMRKEKWWSLLILVPMLLFVGSHAFGFLQEARSFFPNHLLSAGFGISLAIVLAVTVLAFTGARQVYSTTLLVEGGKLNLEFDDTYTAYLEDPSYGTVSIEYEEAIESWMVNADLTRTGQTRLILVSPTGETHTFDLTIERNSYHIEEAAAP